ncbi:serine/threonine protein kinase [Nonomuraea sp. NBC_01738]|uniref:serine/threonine-protein kinase n=1 Tax=Nonomuraea sp. NBC_01738 TaxID=2976003 RepID=UPI002E1483D7|nr:serine/threonine protein kinase [Nonomuraea sp. NBC_01738]
MTSDRKQGGRRIAGRYQLQEPIGKGGMGIVWRAHDELLDRIVAVKEVRYAAVLGDEVALLNRRTMREARAAARFEHPNVIVVHDVIEEDDRPWIVMQLVPSRSLGTVIKQDGPLRPRRVAEIGLAVLDALHKAHEAGVLHRDVKPENVLLADDGRVVLTDFGIATLETETQLTMTGLAGTPAFIAPERLKGLPARRESDLWSLGATLYTALEGKSPHERGMALATMHAVLTDEPDPATHAGPLKPVIDGLLTKEPAERLSYEDTSRMLRQVITRARNETAVMPAAEMEPPAPRPASRPDRSDRSEREDDTPTDPNLKLPETGLKIPGPAKRTPPAEERPSRPPARPAARPSARPMRPYSRPEERAEQAAERSPERLYEHSPERLYELPAEHDPEPRDGFFSDTSDPTMASSGGGERRRLGTVVAVAVAVVLVGGIGGYLGLRSTPSDNTRDPARATAAASTGPTTNAEPPSTSASPEASPTAEPSAETGEDALPKGWKMRKDKTGFSIGLPKGWKEFTREGSRVTFKGPGAASNAFLMIDQTKSPGPDPYKDWKQQEKGASGQFGGYKLIGIEKVDYMKAAADWDFTWVTNTGKTHVRNRGFITDGGYGYAIYWHNLASRWKKDLHFFDSFAATFKPAK